jgi:hypothetical protein
MLRTIAVLLLLTMACGLPTAQGQSAATAQESHPAGCHRHTPAVPAPSPSHFPVPASYECCVNGHHAAIPNAAFSFEPAAGQLCGVNGSNRPCLTVVASFHAAMFFLVPSDSPPNVAPLRI